LLLSDAKLSENSFQQVFHADFAADGAEVVEASADILGDKIGGGIILQAIGDVLEGFVWISINRRWEFWGVL
jgi:hypothetical protein